MKWRKKIFWKWGKWNYPLVCMLDACYRLRFALIWTTDYWPYLLVIKCICWQHSLVWIYNFRLLMCSIVALSNTALSALKTFIIFSSFFNSKNFSSLNATNKMFDFLCVWLLNVCACAVCCTFVYFMDAYIFIKQNVYAKYLWAVWCLQQVPKHEDIFARVAQ